MPDTPHPHVDDSDPLCARVRGTRVPVRRLWAWHQKGVPVETLVRRYATLGWARVLDALSWAHDNEARVERELEDERRVLEREVARCSPIGPVQEPLKLGNDGGESADADKETRR